LATAAASGSAVRDQSKSGTGLTLAQPLTAAHSVGGSARGAGSGVTLSTGATAAHNPGATVTSAPGPTYVLDYGTQLSGLPKISVSGAAGSTVTLIPAELANADGTVSIGSTGASATNQILYRFTPAGNGAQSWHAQFTYNGFRYLQVTGLPAA